VHAVEDHDSLCCACIEWLAYGEADPEGAHLQTMQDCFQRVIGGDGKSIFRSEDDWSAYTKGATAENAKSSTQNDGSVNKSLEANAITPEEFVRTVAEGWVWMEYAATPTPLSALLRVVLARWASAVEAEARDSRTRPVPGSYISIPQVIGCKSVEETHAVLEQQKSAIQAIPDYVAHARNFWICAPSGAKHVDTGMECNYDSWHARGWCRMYPRPPRTPASNARLARALVLARRCKRGHSANRLAIKLTSTASAAPTRGTGRRLRSI
jgi:hypothetical protein